MYNFEGTKIQNPFLIDKYLLMFFLFSILKKCEKMFLSLFLGNKEEYY